MNGKHGNSMNDQLTALTDAQVTAGARPGESWSQARERLQSELNQPHNSPLSVQEWTRFIAMIDDIQRMCIKAVLDSRGLDAQRLLIQVQHLFEYCCACAAGRQVELLPQVKMKYSLFDETYVQLSRLAPTEAEWTPDLFVGLMDVLGHPEPYEHVVSLTEDGALQMVLAG